jgi:aminocarboxymuconate-semialdehyde decarboxylase
MAIDVHCHYIPEAYWRHIQQEARFGVRLTWGEGQKGQLRVGSKEYRVSREFFDLGLQIARMDRLGVSVAVISLATPLINYSAPESEAVRAAEIFNDDLARVRREGRGRFEGWAFLPMQNPEAGARELRRSVQQLGLRGGHIASNVSGRYLSDPAYGPIFEAAVALDVPLFVHPSNPPGQDRLGDYELEVVTGYLFDSTLNIFHAIFGGLLDRYPALKLCVAHVGGYALLLRGRMQREVDTHPELARRIQRPVGEYLKRLYYDTICFEAGYLDYAANVVGSNRLVLGSDAPFLLGEPDPVAFVRKVFGDGRPSQQILHENADTLLKLSRSGSP